MILNKLSKENTLYYKGIAILFIMLHNFLHWIPPIIGQNEQNFSKFRIENYFEIISVYPEYIIQLTISLFGHYGVQIFLFLSAYGLYIKYEKNKLNYLKFIKERIFKLYPAFLVAIFLWLIYIGLISGKGILPLFLESSESILYKILGVSNFIEGELYSLNGPWWFISLILQFYIIFPILLKIDHKYSKYGLLILSICSLIIASLINLNIPITGTILVHVPEVSLGIYMARKGTIKINNYTLFIIFTIFILSNYIYSIWYLSFITATLIYLIFINLVNYKLNDFFIFFGKISIYLFLINGFLRYPLVGYAKYIDKWHISLFLSIVFVLYVSLISLIVYYVFNKISDSPKKEKNQA